jgi:hypothetical protein
MSIDLFRLDIGDLPRMTISAARHLHILRYDRSHKLAIARLCQQGTAHSIALGLGSLYENDMLIIRNILVAVLCAAPLCLFWDGTIVQGLIAGVTALAIAITARSLRPGETAFVISVLRPALVAAAIPGLWIVVQILPLGFLAHPIWRSASAALHEPMLGSISIDPAASVISLGDYLSLAAVTFLSAAVAIDRQRAEWVLSALTIATTISGLTVIGYWFVFSGPLPFAFFQATECVSLGMIFAAANCIRAIEQYGLKRYQARGAQQPGRVELQALVPAIATLAICGLAISLIANRGAVLAAAYGLLTLTGQSVIRRFALGPWGMTGIAAPSLMIAVFLIAPHSAQREFSAPLAFASAALSPEAALSQRMMDDAPDTGIGAGTFQSLAPVYRENKDPPSGPTAATAAAAFAIELGKPMLWLIVAAAAGFTLLLLRGALQRGRDWIYPATAASGLVTVLLLSFVDAGLFGTTTGLVASAMIGLGLAQSKSRSANA